MDCIWSLSANGTLVFSKEVLCVLCMNGWCRATQLWDGTSARALSMVFHFHQMANIWQQLAGMVCLFHCHFFFILLGALPECWMPISFGNLILLSWNVLWQKTGILAQLLIDPDNGEGVYTIVLGGIIFRMKSCLATYKIVALLVWTMSVIAQSLWLMLI